MKKNDINKYIKFSQVWAEMGITILVLAYLGKYLDKVFPKINPYGMVFFSLLGVMLSIWIVIKRVIKMSKGDEEKSNN